MKFFWIFSLISCPVLMASNSVKYDYNKGQESKYKLKLSEIKITDEKQYDILYYQNILLQRGGLSQTTTTKESSPLAYFII